MGSPIPYKNRTFVFRCPHPLRRAGFPPVAKGSPDWAGKAGTGLPGGMRTAREKADGIWGLWYHVRRHEIVFTRGFYENSVGFRKVY